MDDFYGLDRFDRWLNDQRGPRRALLLWIDGLPTAWAISALFLGWLVFRVYSPAGASNLRVAVLTSIALAVPGGFLTSALTTVIIRARRNPRWFQPRFSWRRSAYTIGVTTWLALDVAHLSGGRQRPELPPWLFILPVAFTGLLFWNDHYLKRAARARRARAQGQVS